MPSSGAALRTIGRCLFTIRFYCNHDQLKVYSYGLFPLFLSVYTTTGPITYKYTGVKMLGAQVPAGTQHFSWELNIAS